MEEIWIDTPSGKVFGMTAGDGPLVLGLHGWSQRNGWHTWEPLIEPLADGGLHVISVDMPGWGKSPALDDGRLSSEKAVDVVVALIETLGAGSAALMGKSWGGGVALQTALDHPGRVTKLILTAPAFRDFGRLEQLQQPMLLAWAEDDGVIPISYSRHYVERVPDVRLERYKSGGHSAAPENAGDFAPKAIAFLKEGKAAR